MSKDKTIREPSEASARPRLLIVDDDPLIGDVLLRGLGNDYTVEVVNSAREALALASKVEFALVLSDCNMPDLTGLELRRRVTRNQPAMFERFAFMTGGGLNDDAQRLLRDEAERCLEKPFTIGELREFLRRRVDARSSPDDGSDVD